MASVGGLNRSTYIPPPLLLEGNNDISNVIANISKSEMEMASKFLKVSVASKVLADQQSAEISAQMGLGQYVDMST